MVFEKKILNSVQKNFHNHGVTMTDPAKICNTSVIKTLQANMGRTVVSAIAFLAVGITSAIISGNISEAEEARGLTTTMLTLTGVVVGMSLVSLMQGQNNKKDVAAMFVFASSLLVCLSVSFERQHDDENNDLDTKRAPVIASSIISLLAFVGISGLGVYSATACK